MNNKDYITLYSTFAKLCYFQHNIAYAAYRSAYVSFLLLPISESYDCQYFVIVHVQHVSHSLGLPPAWDSPTDHRWLPVAQLG